MVQRARWFVARAYFFPFVGKALGFGALDGRQLARNDGAVPDHSLSTFTGASRCGEVQPHMGLHIVLLHGLTVDAHRPKVVLRLCIPLGPPIN